MENYPVCQECGKSLVPLSDYGRDGAPITYKAWACTNKKCGYVLRIDNGQVTVGKVGEAS